MYKNRTKHSLSEIEWIHILSSIKLINHLPIQTIVTSHISYCFTSSIFIDNINKSETIFSRDKSSVTGIHAK